MKRVLSIVLIFAAVLAALLGGNALIERFRPAAAENAAPSDEPREQKTIPNEMNVSDATFIRLSDAGTAVSGLGAAAQGGEVVIGYPGTYWIEGSLTDGRIVVDLGDFDGAAYLVLNGVCLASADGPALQVRQADLTAVYLMEGSENTLADGADYMVPEAREQKTGAAIYSADDLLIYGGGALTVCGNSADGIRSKDGLIVADGVLTVYAADDGLQASDLLDVYGGTISVLCQGDGLSTTEGSVTVYDGALSIVSAGDGVAAAADLRIEGGVLAVETYGGAENYEAVALGGLSAKGLKAENVYISGGSITLNTADDGIHAARDACLSGGSFSIASGDDAVHAAGVLDIRDVTVGIPSCYEGIEGGSVRLAGCAVTAAAAHNGVDAGDGGVTAYNASLRLEAPRAVSSDGPMELMGVDLVLAADGTDSLFSFPEAKLIGCTVLAGADAGRSEVLLAKGRLPGSVLFGFSEAVPAGTEFVLSDPSGAEVYSFALDRDASVVLAALGGLLDGQRYTFSAGENVMEFIYDDAGCAVEEPEPVTQTPGGGWGGFPGMPGGPRR